MGGPLLFTLLAALSAAAIAQITTHVGSTGSSSSFQGQGAALAENVGPDGSRQSECAYADSTGQQIQVRLLQQRGGKAQYRLIKGDNSVDPASAYEQCLQQYRASQQAGAAFLPDINAFNPFPEGFDFGGFANAAQGFAGGFGGGANPGFQAGGGGVRHAHNQVGADASQQVPAFLAAQMEALRRQNLQLQQNVFEMQQRNLELHNRLMGQFQG